MQNLHVRRDRFFPLLPFQFLGDSWIFIWWALMAPFAPQSTAFPLLIYCGINIPLVPSYLEHLPLLLSSFFLSMDYLWEPPEGEALKINVHCITSAEPLPNGNTNSVGVVIRNKAGKELWSAAGPMPGKSKLQATLWGIYHVLGINNFLMIT